MIEKINKAIELCKQLNNLGVDSSTIFFKAESMDRLNEASEHFGQPLIDGLVNSFFYIEIGEIVIQITT